MRQAKIKADGLGVTYMQMPIRFGWKTRQHRLMLAGLKVGYNDVANKMAGPAAIFFIHIWLRLVWQSACESGKF